VVRAIDQFINEMSMVRYLSLSLIYMSNFRA
jgi:hypothetical protein